MKRIKLTIYALCFVFVTTITSVTFFGESAFAATDWSSPVIKKSLLAGMRRCYVNNAVSTSAGKLSEFSSFSSLIIGGSSGNYVALPSGLTGVEDNNVSCEQLFMGYDGPFGWGGNFEGVFRLAGRTAESFTSTNQKKSFLNGMGYSETRVLDEDKPVEKCIKFTYDETFSSFLGSDTTKTVETDTICATLNNDGIITDLRVDNLGNYALQPAPGSGFKAFFKIVDGKIRFDRATVESGYAPTYYGTEKGIGDPWDGSDGFLANLRSTLSARCSFSYSAGSGLTYRYSLPGGGCTTKDNYDDETISDEVYVIQEPEDSLVGPTESRIDFAWKSAVLYLTGSNMSLNFNESEKILLLAASMRGYFFSGLNDSSFWVCDVDDWTDYGAFTSEYEIHLAPDGTIKQNCRINSSVVKNTGEIHGFSGNTFDASGGTTLSLKDTINEINRLASELSDDVTIIAPPTVIGGEDDPGLTDGCSRSAGSLGWITCPLLKILGEATDAMFTVVADQYLSISPEILGNPDTSKAWGVFQSFANIIFVIFLLVVILSQVTGFGISNYGIKKILPRLIMVAILVNLSFIICTIAADLSNITGYGFDSFFRGLNVDTAYEDFNAMTGLKDFIGAIGVVGTPLTLGGVALGLTIADGGWSVIIMPLLLAAIVAFFAVLFFYILLAVRKAAIILLIVVSPIAVICYALPNTQKLFSRWLKMFSTLLLLFPICGIVMGGGSFASRLLMITAGNSGFVYYLVCMLLSVVPFFFIPTLLKNSMSALGSIGAKISNMGSRLSNLATGAVKRSRWAQDHQQRIARNIDMNRNNRLQARGRRTLEALNRHRTNPNEDGDLSGLTENQRRRYRRAEYETARAASRFERAAREEDQASVIARQEAFTEGSLRRTAFRDTLADKAQEENIGNLRSAAYHGHLDFTDENGDRHTVDVKNIGGITADGKLMEFVMDDDGINLKYDDNGDPIPIEGARNSLSAAFLNYNRAYDKAMADYNAATTTSDKDAAMTRAQDAKMKAQAIATELLDAGGDNGQTAVGRALKSIKFDDNGNPLGRDLTQSVDEISKFITRNGKWMAQIKKTDNGLFRMLNDAANSAAKFGTRMSYATGGDQKITAEAIPDLSDGYLGGMTFEIKQGTYDNDAKAAGRLIELDEAIQRAMADPRIANRIKPETMKFLQEIHKKAYELQQKQWLEAKDDMGNLIHISELSGYDSAGNSVEANGVNNLGQLTRDGQVLLDSIGGTALHQTDAYAKQIRQQTELVRGKMQDGEIKILRRKELPDDWAYDQTYGWRKKIITYDDDDGVSRETYVPLTAEEIKRAEIVTEHNARVGLQNEENNNRQ